MPHGVDALNRIVHKQFRAKLVKFAREKFKVPKPVGLEEVVYGDKVMNVRNHGRDGYPQPTLDYLANGEIGIVTGQYKPQGKRPPFIHVTFSSQPNHTYSFHPKEFKEEGEPPLELAYALTVHKAQGSEFDKVFLVVLPARSRLISRELLYTALTRHRVRVVIMPQGDFRDLRKFAQAQFSATATRLTNLFDAPRLVAIGGQFLEERLIHRTVRGEAVRSKSEVIIADQLSAAKLPYAYEQPLPLGGTTRYPDFTIEDADTGETVYWEHCGMLGDAEYRKRWDAKLAWYRRNEVLPHSEGGGKNGKLVITEDSPNGGISSQEIRQLIRKVFGV